MHNFGGPNKKLQFWKLYNDDIEYIASFGILIN